MLRVDPEVSYTLPCALSLSNMPTLLFFWVFVWGRYLPSYFDFSSLCATLVLDLVLIDQADLEFRDPPASASLELGLKAGVPPQPAPTLLSQSFKQILS